MDNLKPISSLPPFPKFCCSLGAIPSSYLSSLTYEEQLLWLCDYIQNTLIPTINNNSEAVIQLQNLYVQLKNYVDSYFDNLDVQAEINKKLDEMASDGTLDSIINQEIFGNINNSISEIQHTLNTLNSQPTIMIGDSYAAGHSNGSVITGWCDLLANIMNISSSNHSYYKIAAGSSGFVHKGSTNMNFLEMLQDKASSISNKNDIKNIIVCGGYNDADGSSVATIQNNIYSFISYCKSTFPNATVYIGMIGYNNGVSTEDNTRRSNLANNVIPAYFRRYDFEVYF